MRFRDSIAAGLRAAQTAANARQEIANVIEEFSREIHAASGGGAVLTIGENIGWSRDSKDKSLIGLLGTRTYKSLCITSPKDGFKPVEIAEWRQSPDGYPCYLIYNKSEYACSTKMDLISALNELASLIFVGEAILSAANFTAQHKVDASPPQSS